MTSATIALTELAEKRADIDVQRQMVQFMAQRLMELDVEACCGAGYDEKSPRDLMIKSTLKRIEAVHVDETTNSCQSRLSMS